MSLKRWFAEKWVSVQNPKQDCGSYTGKGRVKCRPSKRVSAETPETLSEMTKEEREKAIRLKNKATREGKQFSSHKSGRVWGSLRKLKNA